MIGLIGAVTMNGNATLLKVRDSTVTGAFGLICLGSLVARRPVMFYLGRSFATGDDPELVAGFEAVWDLPGVPARFRFVTAIWGVVLVAEAAFRTVLALTLPTETFLVVTPVVNWGVLGGLLWFTAAFIRASETRLAAATPEPNPRPEVA